MPRVPQAGKGRPTGSLAKEGEEGDWQGVEQGCEGLGEDEPLRSLEEETDDEFPGFVEFQECEDDEIFDETNSDIDSSDIDIMGAFYEGSDDDKAIKERFKKAEKVIDNFWDAMDNGFTEVTKSKAANRPGQAVVPTGPLRPNRFTSANKFGASSKVNFMGQFRSKCGGCGVAGHAHSDCHVNPESDSDGGEPLNVLSPGSPDSVFSDT